MAAEGEFPKINGDVAYASEYNSFKQNGFLGAGSTIPLASGAAIKDVGSIVIAANTLGNPTTINVDYHGSGGQPRTYIEISGLSTNVTFIGSTSTSWSEPFGELSCMVGSPFVGGGRLIFGQSTSAEPDSNYAISKATIWNLNLAQPVVVKLSVLANAVGSTQLFWHAYTNGRGY